MVDPNIPVPQPPQEPLPAQSISSQPIATAASTKKSPALTLIVTLVGFIVVVLILLGGYMFISHYKSQKNEQNQQARVPSQTISSTPITTPTLVPITPVTASNVDQTLSNVDSSMQQTINQVNTDITNINSIDTTQDNPNNL